MSILKPNSIHHADGREYYLGDLPGRLQYKKTVEELTSITNIDVIDSDCGFTERDPTPDLVARFVPDTATGRAGDWEMVVAFESVQPSGDIWMKGALRDRRTGLIALMTTTNGEDHITRYGNRALRSLADGWYVGFYRMGAPMLFWRRLSNVLKEI